MIRSQWKFKAAFGLTVSGFMVGSTVGEAVSVGLGEVIGSFFGEDASIRAEEITMVGSTVGEAVSVGLGEVIGSFFGEGASIRAEEITKTRRTTGSK